MIDIPQVGHPAVVLLSDGRRLNGKAAPGWNSMGYRFACDDGKTYYTFRGSGPHILHFELADIAPERPRMRFVGPYASRAILRRKAGL